MKYEIVSLGETQNPQNINLGTNCSSSQKISFIKLFNEYKDIFYLSYSYLTT